ncbi:MAG TPA: glycosyltransferase [Candidatus Saccharimonadales bacterium]|nr:glycosyltransferase [Candidatus Saccharimonadales bacterium]
MSDHPKVSVVSISYNQEKYIEQALESFVKQKTNFKFEIIIGDDCSSDNTKRIIENYAKKYPDLIKPVLREKNVGIASNLYNIMNRASGEYLALCEGDDYWTDEHKLQIQADFLDKHTKYALCFHPVKVIYEKNESDSTIFPDPKRVNEYTLTKLLEGNFIQTNSVMYRKQNYNNLPEDILPIDWYLHLCHAQKGEIGFINKVMSVYRRHEEGAWWDVDGAKDKKWSKHGVKIINLFIHLQKLFSGNTNAQNILQQSTSRFLSEIIAADKKFNTNNLELIVQKDPEYITHLLLSQNYTIKKLNGNLNSRRHKQSETKINELESMNRRLNREKNFIVNSKTWRLRKAFVSKLKKG